MVWYLEIPEPKMSAILLLFGIILYTFSYRHGLRKWGSIVACKEYSLQAKRGVGSLTTGSDGKSRGESTPRMWKINPLWMELMDKPNEIYLR